jgi:glycine oxidase
VAAVPAFAELAGELQAFTGESVGLRTEGTLAVAFNADDRAALDRLTEFRRSLGLVTESLTGRQARGLEPYLAAGVRSGVLAVDDLSVDNRQYVSVLRSACLRRGVGFVTATVTGLQRTGARVTGVHTDPDGPADPGGPADPDGALAADAVVLCAGALTERLRPVGVHPVKGQILRLSVPARLRAAGPVLTRTIRGLVRGGEVYLVPRLGGEIVVGATSEQQGEDTTVTAGGVYELLRNAYDLLPISSEFEFIEARAGSRPGTADNGPVVGELEPGLLVATGHYRNGILLSAITARAVTRLVVGLPLAEQWEPFGPTRFHP